MTVMYKMVNGVRMEMTTEEVTKRLAEEAEWAAGATQRKLKAIREERALKIAETDYLMLEDSPLADKTALKAYRQALRDVTKQPDLDNIVWPVKPV